MLDFYLIHDSQNPSSKGLDLKRIGGIKDELFFQLQTEGIIDSWFDYYGKFRWGNELVVRMLTKLRGKPNSLTLQHEQTAFIAILQKAVDANSGLLAFGD
ncbi:hypothetical protein [Hymenobacter glacieicola]|uniref:DUF262 domain-containing protein n=1 Tax=Hymenobacter glacieicola TaxID=1562124 RepID=A0ABQ1X359_9BACT|nr:hypothetical protein [Hymenobacter glacieicola]GGG53771.1 hypothetical protein GCM10011378_32490 [Hymenobacter glacieicola]